MSAVSKQPGPILAICAKNSRQSARQSSHQAAVGTSNTLRMLAPRERITLNAPCAHCNETITLDDASTGDAFECPACEQVVHVGDEGELLTQPRPRTNRRRETSLRDTPDHPSQTVAQPKASETHVMRVRPSVARSQPVLFFLMVTTLAVSVLGAAWLLLQARSVWLLAIVALPAPFCAGWLVWTNLRARSSELRITTRRVIASQGFLSKRITEVLIRDIRKLELHQTLWQRLCGVGELAICADGEDGPEVHMAQVPHPHQVRNAIDAQREL